MNPADTLILNGRYAKEFGTHLPLILGYDMAGVVTKTGTKITKLKVGVVINFHRPKLEWERIIL